MQAAQSPSHTLLLILVNTHTIHFNVHNDTNTHIHAHLHLTPPPTTGRSTTFDIHQWTSAIVHLVHHIGLGLTDTHNLAHKHNLRRVREGGRGEWVGGGIAVTSLAIFYTHYPPSPSTSFYTVHTLNQQPQHLSNICSIHDTPHALLFFTHLSNTSTPSLYHYNCPQCHFPKPHLTLAPHPSWPCTITTIPCSFSFLCSHHTLLPVPPHLSQSTPSSSNSLSPV